MHKDHSTRLELDFGSDGQQLVPVVAQDSRSKEVLILAFANEEAFRETLKSKMATFYSRSRKEIWKKGLTSGDMLRVDEIRINCEQNSLIYLVTPLGRGACHVKKADGTPHASCYFRKLGPDDTLEYLAR